MVLAIILSAASLVIAAAGFFLMECSSPVINLFGNDPTQICSTLVELGMNPEPWLGISLFTVGILGVLYAWAPTQKRRETRADLRSISAMQKNLNRVEQLPEQETGTQVATEVPEVDDLTALKTLIDDLRVGLEGQGTVRQDLMETWIATLRICNDLHNSGDLETGDFKKLNTRLLGLMRPDLSIEPAPVSQ